MCGPEIEALILSFLRNAPAPPSVVFEGLRGMKQKEIRSALISMLSKGVLHLNWEGELEIVKP